MTKLEKAIQGLEHCRVDNCSEGSICPYYSEEYCSSTLMYDALELLREQEPVKPINKSDMNFCGECKFALAKTMNYCPKCGKEVKWE